MASDKRERPSDRRAHVRRAVRQVCQAAVPGLGIVSCVITDYCPVGLFLRVQGRPEELRTVSREECVAIVMSVNDTKHKVLGTIARATSQGLGVRFDTVATEIVDTLEAVAQSQNQADQSVEYMMPGVSDLVAELAVRCRTFTRTCIGDFSVRAAMTLSSRALASTNDEEANGFYHARSHLRAHEAELLEQFPIEVQESCLALGGTREVVSLEVNSEPELELTDNDDFGHWLSVSELAAKADARYPVQLFDLSSRINTLAERVLEPAENPFAPLAIAQLFSLHIRNWPLSSAAFEILYSSFAKAVIAPWETLLNELNAVMIQHKVQPSINHGLDAWHRESSKPRVRDLA